jgi:predicted nucleic acid-binding protein
MTLPDVNVLIEAIRPDAPNYLACRRWIESVVNGDELYGMSPLVLSSVARIMTNPRMVPHPYTLGQILEFSDLLLDQPHCRIIQPGPRHWRIFSDLCRKHNATGNLVPDT